MKKAFFYGDSNTFGYDPAGFMGGRYPRAARWTTILQDNLAGEWEIDADGMPGRSIPTSRYEWDYLRGVIQRRMPLMSSESCWGQMIFWVPWRRMLPGRSGI